MILVPRDHRHINQMRMFIAGTSARSSVVACRLRRSGSQAWGRRALRDEPRHCGVGHG